MASSKKSLSVSSLDKHLSLTSEELSLLEYMDCAVYEGALRCDM